MRRILTIAGSDTSGGAGIQADLKTITALGKYGLTAVTSLTSQTGEKVLSLKNVDVGLLKSQLKCCSIIGFDAIKIGLVPTAEIINCISKFLTSNNLYLKVPVILDPVLIAGSGKAFLGEKEINSIKQNLLPYVFIITPNTKEAEMLANLKIHSKKDIEKSATIIKNYGMKYVLIKGGHLQGDYADDILFDGNKFYDFSKEKIKLKCRVHGTGCIFSTAIACYLSDGYTIFEAIREAKDFIYGAIRYSFDFGKKVLFPNTNFFIEKQMIINELQEAAKDFINFKHSYKLIPEVSSNLAYALPCAKDTFDVAAFPGRIVKVGKEVKIFTTPQFNVSSHIAKVVLTIMKYDRTVRSAMNIRYSDSLIKQFRKTDFKVSFFSRENEPENVSKKEGSSLEWGVKECIEKLGGNVPDIIYDKGGWGKEAMIRVLGRNPKEVIKKIEKIIIHLKDEEEF